MTGRLTGGTRLTADIAELNILPTDNLITSCFCCKTSKQKNPIRAQTIDRTKRRMRIEIQK